jgi:redox-sensing transcriptional repressor
MMVSNKIIARLSQYRRLLHNLRENGLTNIYSHELASMVGVTAAQVRRDIMNIGYSGNPNRGYDIAELVRSIAHFLDAEDGQKVALIGVGNLGRAILSFFIGRRPKLSIEAAFDSDPQKYGRVIHGCRCYSSDNMSNTIKELGITIGIITVPVQEAQKTADIIINAGVSGILNFAPVALRVPYNVYVEDIDMTTTLETVAYFSRHLGNNAKGV